MFCFVCGFRDMMMKGKERRYFLIGSWQIRYFFYPIFLGLVLELFGLRVDLVGALIVALVCVGGRVDRMVLWISRKIDGKVMGKRGIGWGMRPSGCLEELQS
jgi:hypothetical protein